MKSSNTFHQILLLPNKRVKPITSQNAVQQIMFLAMGYFIPQNLINWGKFDFRFE